MPLPNLEKMVGSFPLTIPSTGQSIRFRPFFVKEEKILLIALESSDEASILDSVIEVIKNCALTPIKADTLAEFDIEFLFLQLRARSVNNTVELKYKCHNTVDKEGVEESCDNIVTIIVNLDDIKVLNNPEHSKTIFLTETMGVTMRYPSYKTKKIQSGATTKIDKTIHDIAVCVESVFDATSVYSQFALPELQQWIECLTQPQFIKIEQFFATIPKLAHDVDFNCPRCGYHDIMHLEGIASFFE